MNKVSIICMDEMSALATIAHRSVLEYFGQVASVHWIGNKPAFMDILSGKTPTEQMVILSCHGGDEKFYLSNDEEVTIDELNVSLKDKIVVSTGCDTGKDPIAAKFIDGGCSAYIAPTGYPEGNDALLFVIQLFWALSMGWPIEKSFSNARKQMPEGSEFALFVKSSKGFTGHDS